MQHEKFDLIVIGSSPMLMLYALRARQAGKSVVLIEETKALGGAWSIDNHMIGAREIAHENACHLIEWYAGGYELIESISGVNFLPLEPQPIKVWCNGRHELYTSRLSILLAFILACSSFLYSFVKFSMFYLGLKKNNKNPRAKNISNAYAKMKIEFRYRFIFTAMYQGIRAPEGGFANFINILSGQLLKQGVDVVNGRAEGLFLNNDGSGSIAVDAKKIYATRIVVGESTLLNNFQSNDFRYDNYHHILVSLRASETICRNPYIHFPDHPIFHRMTYVEDSIDENGIEISIFLVQLRMPLEDISKLKNYFEGIKNLYPIVKSMDYFKILKTINSKNISSCVDSGWYNFEKNKPIVIKTIGDISRNMILMKQFFVNQKKD